MFKQIKSMWKQLFFLLLLAVFFFCVYAGSMWQWLNDFSMSMATSFLSVIVTIVFIDFFITEREAAEKNEIKAACLRTLRPAIADMAELFSIMLKATSIEVPKQKNMEVAFFFETISIKSIAQLYTLGEAPISPKRTWENHIIDCIQKFVNNLNSFNEKFGIHMGASEIDLCHKILRHFCVQIIVMLPSIHLSDSEAGIEQRDLMMSFIGQSEEGKSSMLEDFLNSVAALTRIVEGSEPEKLMINLDWQSSAPPLLGSGLRDGHGLLPCVSY